MAYQNDMDEIFEKVFEHINHDLRTSLMNIGFMSQNVQNILPKLMDIYFRSKNLGLQDVDIDEETLSELKIVLQNVEAEVKWSHWYLSTVRANLQAITKEKYPLMPCSIKKYVQFILNHYPFKGGISVINLMAQNEIEDFDFFGNEILVKQVLFNLLDNATYSISAAEKGEIYLSSSKDQYFNYLYFKDTGSGIPLDAMSKLYKKFFSTKNKIGVGLYFCKEAMQFIGGDINCEAEPGRYALFILKFPKI